MVSLPGASIALLSCIDFKLHVALFMARLHRDASHEVLGRFSWVHLRIGRGRGKVHTSHVEHKGRRREKDDREL